MSGNFDFDTAQLGEYLKQHIDDFAGPLNAEKFSGGQSNPTFLLSTAKQKYVLRRKPPGKLLAGAHAVDREFKVLSALSNTDVPVARALHLCKDDEIIGSMFYVMEYVDGRVLWDPSLPDMTNEQRSAIYQEMNDTLARLHKVNVDQVGLADYGKKESYFERQIHTWSKQYRAAETTHNSAMEHLLKWLPANIPAHEQRYGIAHGDYRLDNLMFAHDEARVIAILDWELSTVGHPYADLAYQCMQYYMPRDTGLPGLGGVELAASGIPTQQQYIDSYCQNMNIDGIEDWNFYIAFSLFRLASICQGIEKRRLDGTASSDQARAYAALVEPLAAIAVKQII